ncbi:MAG: hypothetical protein ACLQLT_13125 [Methylovirgula sp.]
MAAQRPFACALSTPLDEACELIIGRSISVPARLRQINAGLFRG